MLNLLSRPQSRPRARRVRLLCHVHVSSIKTIFSPSLFCFNHSKHFSLYISLHHQKVNILPFSQSLWLDLSLFPWRNTFGMWRMTTPLNSSSVKKKLPSLSPSLPRRRDGSTKLLYGGNDMWSPEWSKSRCSLMHVLRYEWGGEIDLESSQHLIIHHTIINENTIVSVGKQRCIISLYK